MPVRYTSLILLLAAAPLLADIPADVELDPAFGGQTFNFPVGVRHAGDGSGRKFIIERDGLVQIVDDQGNVAGDPFLDISAQVDTTFEGGFLGLAFHPDYASNGRFFVKYTYNSSSTFNTELITRISEFLVSDTEPDEADPDSERIIIEIPQDSNNHNGGDLHFGPDGFLYFGMGDGGGSNDPCDRGQTLDPDDLLVCGNHATTAAKALLGKMVRIDIDATTPAGDNNLCAAAADGSAEYAVPDTNPFADSADRCGEVWAYGKRNPYRFSFDRDTGDLWAGDVGQNTWEEINFEPADDPGGRNYGWKICEGNWLRGSTSNGCTILGHAGPVIEYPSSGNECSVTGGFRYRGPVASMQGRYVYGDYCSGRIWFAEELSPGNWTNEEFGLLGGFGDLVGFGEDEDGHLYVVRGFGQILVFNGGTEMTYSIGGNVNGLEGTGLVLLNNGGDALSIESNGSFEFATELAENDSYEVSVLSQPTDPLQDCMISNESGDVGTSDIDSVSVDCVTLDDEVFEDRFELPDG